jgi:hypothetical protein
MRYIRTLTPGAVVLALTIILAACTQAASPTPSPSASPEPIPTEEPAPSDSPSEPAETPTPSEPTVVEHELPMIGRVTDDGVEVRTEPSLDAPILTGESFTDPGTMPEIVLDADDLVYVTLGPVFAEDESWYEVASVDGGDVNFAFGWVPGRYLEREDDSPAGFPVVVDIHGQGEGGSVTVDVLVGTPVSVRFAALPMPDADSCELDVTVIKTDGLGVNVATETITEVTIVELTSNQLSSLFQEEAGTVTLEVETDCSFAATMTMPQS